MKKRAWQAAAGLWGLLARISIYKIAGILLGMAAVQIGLFYGSMVQVQGEKAGFERVLEQAGVFYPFQIALGAVFLALLWTQGEHGGRSRYTLLRLPLTWPQILTIRILYNLLCFLLVFTVQAAVILGLAQVYRSLAGEEIATGQMVFLAFYRNAFLHNLWPMAEIGKWIRNILLFLTLSLEAAAGYRRKGYVPAAMLLVVLLAWVFQSEAGINLRDGFCDLMLLIVAGGTLWGLWGSGEKPEPEEKKREL